MKTLVLACLATLSIHLLGFAALAAPRLNPSPRIVVLRAPKPALSAMVSDSHLSAPKAPKAAKKAKASPPKPSKRLVCGMPVSLQMSTAPDRSHFTNPGNRALSENQTVRICEYR